MSIPLKVMWGGMKGEQKRNQVQTQSSRPGAAVELLDDQGVVRDMLQNASRDKGIHAVALKGEHPQIAHHIHSVIVKEVKGDDIFIHAEISTTHINHDLPGRIELLIDLAPKVERIGGRNHIAADRVIVATQPGLQEAFELVQLVDSLWH